MSRGSVLHEIAEASRLRVEAAKRRVEPAAMRAKALGSRKPMDFGSALRRPGWHVIAEVKLASPSEGPLGAGLDPVGLAQDYARNGAAALSILTEPDYFSGSLEHLSAVRRDVELPLLMKDFVVDEYQLWQARAAGADAALLIAALLGEAELERLIRSAISLGLTPLVETHSQAELASALGCGARLVGVNNRDLKTLKIDLETSRRLAPLARMAGVTLVCESGLRARAEIEELAGLGYKGFLIGTHLVKSGRPGAALAELLGREPR